MTSKLRLKKPTKVELQEMLASGKVKRACDLGLKGGFLYVQTVCPICDNTRWVLRSMGRPGSLCKLCNAKAPKTRHRGSAHYRWKGGRRKNKSGYVLCKIYPDDIYFPMADSTGHVMEHRLVMAKHLGRCLLPQEKVHHIDGIKDNNIPENLELMSQANHNLRTSLCKNCYVRNEVNKLKKQINHLEKLVQLKMELEENE